MDGWQPLLREAGIEMNDSHRENTPNFDHPHKTSAEITRALPDFDKNRTTSVVCAVGLVISWLAVLVCIFYSIWILGDPTAHCFNQVTLPPSGAEATSFFLNIFVALFTDTMGYIHATSLRWALYREDRLHFNTKIRLFNSAQKSGPNRWPANVICIAGLILSYAATSQIFVTGIIANAPDGSLYAESDAPFEDFGTSYTYVSGISIASLGLGLFDQAAVSTWCLFSSSKLITSWSSDPLNNTLALLHEGLDRRPGRCMISIHQANLPSLPTQPLKRQGNALQTNRSVFYILIAIWLLALLAIVWAVTIVFVSRNSVMLTGIPWSITASWTPVVNYAVQDTNDVTLFMSPNYNNDLSSVVFPFGVQVLFGILFTCAIQGAQTIGLHCIELLVNMSRDEGAWRVANASGKSSTRGPLALAARSELISSITVFEDGKWYSFDMIYMRIFVFSIVATALAVFTTYLALRRPSGSQPAAWGHFQTLANVIDDWNFSPDGDLWWVDKGIGDDGVRHAGTVEA